MVWTLPRPSLPRILVHLCLCQTRNTKQLQPRLLVRNRPRTSQLHGEYVTSHKHHCTCHPHCPGCPIVPTNISTTAPLHPHLLQCPQEESTGGTGTAPTTHGGLRGVPPTIFDGNRANADDFWSEFRRYKLNNRTHPAMTLPFDRVLTALSYIRGPLVNDWVNGQEEHLTTRTDITQTPHVLESDEVLWTEFTTAFQNSWKDSSKKQNAHDQLRKLVMKGWDIDTYIVTFE